VEMDTSSLVMHHQKTVLTIAETSVKSCLFDFSSTKETNTTDSLFFPSSALLIEESHKVSRLLSIETSSPPSIFTLLHLYPS
jgi:hypothetical protein